MRIKPEQSERLEKALTDADDAFWAVIADRFRPEATGGDYPPDLAITRDVHNKEDVLWWLFYNGPGLIDD